MDILKVFVDEPAALEVLTASGDTFSEPVSIEDLVKGRNHSPGYGRAYFAGTRLPDQPDDALKVGVTALAHSGAFIQPLVALAGTRTWTVLRTDGTTSRLLPADATESLARPGDVVAIALADSLLSPAELTAAIGTEGRDGKRALRAALDADPSLALLIPEPAHDGYDWSLVARSPLRDTLVAALRARLTPPGVRVFIVPHRKARSEHTFYFEQWSLENPPDGTEEIVHQV